jgi:teichuronic acid biosynthesis glycosyltransferase TuaG
MTTPAVSVVITTYNSAQFIECGLKSVLAQTFADYEIIVVDDGSSDETCSLVEDTLDGRCMHRLIRLERNCGGPAEPRNVGIRQANGGWVALLDADDLWHPQKLEIQLAVASELNARFVSSEKLWFRNPEETVVRNQHLHSLSGHRLRMVRQSNLRRKNFLCTSSVLADSALLAKFPFDPNPDYRAVEDYRCWLDIHEAELDQSWQILTPLVFYRVSSTSISASKVVMAGKLWRLYGDYFRGKPWGRVQRFSSFVIYAFSSLYRQVRYRHTRCN